MPSRRQRVAAVLLLLAAALAGCRAKHYAAHADTTGTLPPNTVQLSTMMRTLSAQPGFTEHFLALVQGGHKSGAALLTPDLINLLRRFILGGNWQGLDRFPGWTMREINPTVRVAGHFAGKSPALQDSATAGGAPAARTAATFLDLGDYALDRPASADLDQPARGPGFIVSDYVSALGDGVTRGDGPNTARAPLHAQSARLANIFNRLGMNGSEGVAPFTAQLGGHTITTPQALVAALQATGHTVAVVDSRYFANFGHLHWNGEDVMMPFWVNPQVNVPGTGWLHTSVHGRPLLVPVSHAEYEWNVRGPSVNADVSFYFGIDGKAEFRTMDQLDQAWVMNRHAHTYTGPQAVEVTRLSGFLVPAYMRLHQAHPAMPFGGYYAFGVCQDVVAAIELKMTGTSTLFPNTADASFFTNPRDAEINALIRRIPKDRDGHPPALERVFGSLPVGSSDPELRTIAIPGLAADLIAVHAAWSRGTVYRPLSGWPLWLVAAGAAAICAALAAATTRRLAR